MAAVPAGVSLPQFNSITLGGSASASTGTLKFNSNGIGWKAKSESGRTVTVISKEIASIHWIRLNKKIFQLKIVQKDGKTVKFDGFQEVDKPNLSLYLREHFKLELQDVSLATKGWNWGSFHVQGANLSFKVEDKQAFEVPFSQIATAQLAKNEINVKFSDTAVGGTESLLEMRFSVPTIPGEKEGEPPIMTAESFLRQMLSKIDVQGSDASSLVHFPNLQFLAPRGRYSVEMLPTFFELHGKTFSYQIKYEHVSRLFELPTRTENNTVFVISLDPPIKQGQTTYPHLLLHASTNTEVEGLSITLPKDQERKYPNLVGLAGLELNVVRKAFETFLPGRQTTGPGTFQSHYKTSCIKCSFKANDGYLYPLEKGFFYIHKPPLHIPFNSISQVEFARLGTHNTFDLIVTVKGSARENNVNYVFSSIARLTLPFLSLRPVPPFLTFFLCLRLELSNLQQFVAAKRITVGGTQPEEITAAPTVASIPLGDEDDDGMSILNSCIPFVLPFFQLQ
jgi:structure-specific recognition protein 1